MGGRTDHDNTSAETLGGEADNTGLASNGSSRLTLVLSLSKERDEGVGGVGDDGADDTGEVTRGEGDTELGVLGVRVLGRGEDLGVEELDDLLEEEELGHGVGDLKVTKHVISKSTSSENDAKVRHVRQIIQAGKTLTWRDQRGTREPKG